MPHGYFYDTSTNIAVTTDSNTFSTVFNTDYPNNQITGFQLNGVDIGSKITQNDSNLFLTTNNYHYLINSNNINMSFSITKPKPRITATNYASITTNGSYTLYEFHTGSVGTFKIVTSISNIVLDMNVLLIGGGGAGGHYSSGGGPGGGGAGSYVTTLIKARPNGQINVNVGNGGSGTSNGNASGSMGDSSTLTYVVKNVFTSNSYSLVAAGGGSGGSSTAIQGMINFLDINGSTGGAHGTTIGTPSNNTASSTNAGYMSTDTGLIIFTNIASSVNMGGSVNYTYPGTGGGGGGGAGGPGQTINGPSGGNGGAGNTWTINNVTYAGGGGGAKSSFGGANNSYGGSGGGGNSAILAGQNGNALPNTGSGGGAGWAGIPSGNGGSGICIIAVKTSDISL
jgi:hypothetical protein